MPRILEEVYNIRTEFKGDYPGGVISLEFCSSYPCVCGTKANARHLWYLALPFLFSQTGLRRTLVLSSFFCLGIAVIAARDGHLLNRQYFANAVTIDHPPSQIPLSRISIESRMLLSLLSAALGSRAGHLQEVLHMLNYIAYK